MAEETAKEQCRLGEQETARQAVGGGRRPYVSSQCLAGSFG